MQLTRWLRVDPANMLMLLASSQLSARRDTEQEHTRTRALVLNCHFTITTTTSLPSSYRSKSIHLFPPLSIP